MNWTLLLGKKSKKRLRTLQKKDRGRIATALFEMLKNPFAGDIKYLSTNPKELRRRVGNWRIFYELDEEHGLIKITDIERRTSTTYRKKR